MGGQRDTTLSIQGSGQGTTLAVHVVPRGKKSQVLGVHGDAVKVRVSAPPVEGAANEELIRFLAEVWHVSRSQVQILSGQTSRRKIVAVSGLDPEEVLAQLLGQKK